MVEVPSEESLQAAHREALNEMRASVDARLAILVPDRGGPSAAARHSLLLPGKRLRALLTIAAAKDAGGDLAIALDPACAIEMVHTASLVFDDLPSMDDADIRRGAETPHILFGEDVAILAGIGLLNGAFGVMARAPNTTSDQRNELVRVLSDAVGWTGLVDGQALDLCSDQSEANTSDVEAIHHGKTGALFVAAAVSGVISANAEAGWVTSMTRLGTHLGQAYQAFDDVVDVVASEQDAGKPTGADDAKATALSISSDRTDAVARAQSHLTAAIGEAPAEGILATLLTDIGAHFERLIAPHVSAA